jgi:hypothetical protein
MAYQFASHQRLFRQAMLHFPWLFIAQIPEGLLSLIQKYFETEWADSPKLAFLVLYPLYCASAAICSAATFVIIRSQSETAISFRYLTKELFPKMKFLILTSWLLGLVMIPATLALVFPGIWVFSHYLFLPFCILTTSEQSLSSYFSLSKSLASTHRQVCLLTAFLSIWVSLLSYFGMGLLSQWIFSPTILLGLEAVLGMLLSVTLTTWTATLYLEVSQK